MIWILILLVAARSQSLLEPNNVIIQYLYRPKNCTNVGVHGDTMYVQYLGRFYNSKEKFDSSYDRNNIPFNYVLGVGGVIEGYQIGTTNMCINERRRLIVPSKFAYGARGTGGIPGYSTLMFDVHLVQIGDIPPENNIPLDLPEDPTVTGNQDCENPVKLGDVLTIIYVGWLPDDTIFDKSSESGLQFVVGAGQILQGIDEGIVSFCKGSVIEFEIPPVKAYGDRWEGPVPQWSYVYYNITITDQQIYHDQQKEVDNELHCDELKTCQFNYHIQRGDFVTLNYKIMSKDNTTLGVGDIRYLVGRQLFVPGWDEVLIGSCVDQRKRCWIPGSKAHKLGTSLFLAPPQKGFWCELEVKNILLTYENDFDEIDLKNELLFKHADTDKLSVETNIHHEEL